MRRLARRALAKRLAHRARPLAPERLDRPTVVLAPHPDDETLGCGGLIARLSEHGTPVTIVFLTDGALSHPGDDRAELVATRRREATAAAAELGVAPGHLHFLEHPDGGLAAAVDPAAASVCAVLSDAGAQQLVMPHPDEPNRDHAAAYRVGRAATARLGRDVDALLYGVWIWDQWPWTNPLAPPRGRHARRELVRTALRGRLGLANVGRFDTFVDVGCVRDRKRRALECHATQTARTAGDPDRLTLADVAGGEWLELLTATREFYRSASWATVGSERTSK